MSLMDQTKVDSSIPSVITLRTLPRRSRLRQKRSTRLSLSMRQTTQVTTYNFSYEHLLKSSQEIVDSSLHAITRIKFLNPSIPDVQLWSSVLKGRKSRISLLSSLNDSTSFWIKKKSIMIRKFLFSSLINIFLIGEEFSTSVRGTPLEDKLIREYLRLSQTLL